MAGGIPYADFDYICNTLQDTGVEAIFIFIFTKQQLACMVAYNI